MAKLLSLIFLFGLGLFATNGGVITGNKPSSGATSVVEEEPTTEKPDPCQGVNCGECRECRPSNLLCFNECPREKQYNCVVTNETCAENYLCSRSNECPVTHVCEIHNCFNQNGLFQKKHCQIGCYLKSIPKPCRPQPFSGPCKASIDSWFYHQTRQACLPFIYGGCQGNSNRFQTKALCEQTCIAPQIAAVSGSSSDSDSATSSNTVTGSASSRRNNECPLPPANRPTIGAMCQQTCTIHSQCLSNQRCCHNGCTKQCVDL